MAYSILPTRQFSKDFAKLKGKTQARIRAKVEEIGQDLTRYKRLHYGLKGSCRARVAKFRIVFSYDEKRKELYLEALIQDHRYR